jgi:hypothetical protein
VQPSLITLDGGSPLVPAGARGENRQTQPDQASDEFLQLFFAQLIAQLAAVEPPIVVLGFYMDDGNFQEFSGFTVGALDLDD